MIRAQAKPSLWRRLSRFLRSVRDLWRMRLVNRHNLRAMWLQSGPGWLEKEGPLVVTDEEWDAFVEAMQFGSAPRESAEGGER